jgi:hypothetical protein
MRQRRDPHLALQPPAPAWQHYRNSNTTGTSTLGIFGSDGPSTLEILDASDKFPLVSSALLPY